MVFSWKDERRGAEQVTEWLRLRLRMTFLLFGKAERLKA